LSPNLSNDALEIFITACTCFVPPPLRLTT
jgi:hypothetical protein